MKRKKLLVDTAILIGFLLSTAPHFTGNTIHEWLGTALAVTLIVHILMHWEWIISVGANYFKKLWQVSRLQFIVDVGVFTAFLILITSGLMMSKIVMSTLGIPLTPSHAWKPIHSITSNAAVILTGIHFALNWSLVVRMIKTYVIKPVLSIFQKNSARSISVADHPGMND